MRMRTRRRTSVGGRSWAHSIPLKGVPLRMSHSSSSLEEGKMGRNMGWREK